MEDLFELPSIQVRKRFAKAGAYDESKHPRDNKGRWVAGAVGAVGALAGAAALGVPGVRNIVGLRRLRTAVLGARTASARRVAQRIPLMSTTGVPGGGGVHVRAQTEHLRRVLGQHGLKQPSAAALRREAAFSARTRRNPFSSLGVFNAPRGVRGGRVL